MEIDCLFLAGNQFFYGEKGLAVIPSFMPVKKSFKAVITLPKTIIIRPMACITFEVGLPFLYFN
jgi:hypothetical protein